MEKYENTYVPASHAIMNNPTSTSTPTPTSALSLSLIISGPGTDPSNRSHWSLGLYSPSQSHGRIFQVLLLDPSRRLYHFDARDDVAIRRAGESEGSFALVSGLERESVKALERVVRDEEAPRDGVERCQDWVLRVVISLEVEGLVMPGTAEMVGGLVGRSAVDVRGVVGERWVGADES